MGWLNGFVAEESTDTYFAPRLGLNSLLGQFNAYVLKVVDEAGNPIAGALVTCTNGENSDTHSFTTDSDGLALFEPFVEWSSLVESRYIDTNVAITAPGYATFEFSYQTSGQGDYRVITLTSRSGMMTRDTGIILVDDIPRENTNDTCYCLLECEYREKVFTDGTGVDFWKNDKSSFLQRKISASDSVVFQLWKSGVKLADISTNVYGEYYPSFPTQPNYLGLVIEWRKVHQLHGFGNYQVKVERTILGNSDTVTSRTFQLLPYSDLAANNTVVIESYQTGNVLSSQFDYTGLVDGGWMQRWRVAGTFGDKTPTLDTDRLEDSDRNTIQIQDKVSNEYTLHIRSVTAEIFNAITQDAILGNTLLLTDFNVFNAAIYRRLSVRPTSFETTQWFRNRRVSTIIKLTDSVQNIVKRNF